ncbi:hypothetical protein GLOIN_2v1534004 [Rhizophagus irregularis DAOM 181602=DAOM 197198]|uniref:Uncharacterized protein n=2 Tax=Rhizophagus irregularis TaxID=588596 RepID=A0A2N1NVW4_9GLOM|nr:hypothetical protein GLOIN_2v1534004 [Rhizophagus irregularis DAOM 181602=DAOM 197198]PKK78029.1 hypothetical protein RhiirC2_730610 [Rhizophagus irregularis]POG78934.1 hypothetical protein GLOIN_2v1534004 [Rhizophagus irregularis DAOM 181602=DAOM 197198]|eukprot:XP_025185800.1 hypothetical protein GLOIN_2v1534004 [Rhizophagus irregularis DAOM 181602=DAOM 197198]
MRKAFAFLTSSLSSINKYSKEAKTSTQTTSPNIQKENNKSQIITSNIKDDKNENLIKKNNNDVNPLNKRKKNISNDLKKPTLKKSPQEIKKLESTRKTSSRTDSSTIVTTLKHSSSNRRKKLSVIKKSDDGDGESENASDSNIDNEEEDNDDDNVPLGLRFHHSRSISSNYPPLHANYINLDLVILESENFHLRLHHRHRRALIVMAADIIENIMRILHVSSSGSGGPPTPTSRRSSIMFNSNVYGSRPSTPSSVGSGFPCTI